MEACIKVTWAFLLLIAHQTSVAKGDLAPTWDYCNCRWEVWEAWSDCNSDCFGRRVRTRSVWLTEYAGCDEFTDCATNDEGSDWQDCNNVCHNGGVASGFSFPPCTCQAGYTSSCCTERVNCGDPASITDGTVTVSSTYYGGTATYTCSTHYNMTGGDSVRQCQNNFAWSGSQPSCVFANHCGSAPCQNGATCVNLLGDFRCDCLQGWSGQLCENDIQPPLMTGCSADVYKNATDNTVWYNWTAPSFTDPMGSHLDIVYNYPSPEFTFPWGDHTVQYVATKVSNGLVTECSFKIKVRPTPCQELNIPVNGARLCNGWQTEYGQLCMLTCQQNYTIDPAQSYYTWYVCGASGTWIAASPVPDCEVDVESDECLSIYS
ncbi:sushi, von Willebrand factor type A, EGF and pentraxin domain-containing protein 1-like isoform X2 [Mercenaria mercenaria]|uniref:sushi, von Willebrand factor type A, EGF and pentraxin domain-containing protein 1-like isoform X2 n=1 Tax=Mercenaria mercenaria TaxID=6596 RepID=UPI00234F8C64|nr:sushi, von Willebrand factor type A, EGF and pentraxin domain-containing protein 1-like isoform X2 [Mercenaria mercenaria]